MAAAMQSLGRMTSTGKQYSNGAKARAKPNGTSSNMRRAPTRWRWRANNLRRYAGWENVNRDSALPVRLTIQFLDHLLGVRPDLRIDTRFQQKLQGAARGVGAFVNQLRLGQRQQV